MNRPSFQFYPGDWRGNAKLRRCSHAARGAWVDILCVLHDSDEYGVCRWPLADLAMSAGVPIKLAEELRNKDVLKGGDAGMADFTHTTRHAGQETGTHILIAKTDAPCWYSSRMVRDEWLKNRRGTGTRFESNRQPIRSPLASPTRRVGMREGDGSSSSSSSSSSNKTEGAPAPVRVNFKVPELPEIKLAMAKAGIPESEAEKFLNYYGSNGWKVGKNPMRSWTHAVGTWALKYKEANQPKSMFTINRPKSNEPRY